MEPKNNSSAGNRLVFLKLGGSLITDKLTPRTPQKQLLDRVAGEIRAALAENPNLRIVLGHGSGSFGHYSGSQHQTKQGVSSHEEWQGFSEVWDDAASLNRLVMTALRGADLAAVAFPPSATILTQNRKIVDWKLAPIQAALEHNLLPVIYGDVVFDHSQGGTILSTEDLFVHLAASLRPQRILLAGRDPGVWQDFPDCTRLFEEITPADKANLQGVITQSQATDVTGGMGEKVNQMLDLVSSQSDLEVLIFSGVEPGDIQRVLAGEFLGTRLHS
jgi:isopentenyl phosphate kinase